MAITGWKASQRLDRSLETDRSGVETVFGCGLGDHRANEIVGQDVRPDFLAHQLRCFAPQNFHVHGLFQISKIKFRIPSSAVELREIVLRVLACVQQCRGHNDFLGAKAWLFDLDLGFPHREIIGKRIVGLRSIERGCLGFGQAIR